MSQSGKIFGTVFFDISFELGRKTLKTGGVLSRELLDIGWEIVKSSMGLIKDFVSWLNEDDNTLKSTTLKNNPEKPEQETKRTTYIKLVLYKNSI